MACCATAVESRMGVMVSGIEFQLPLNSEIELYSRLRKLSPSSFLRPSPLLFCYHPNYSTRSLLRLPVPHSLVFAIVLFPFPCSESLLLSQLIFVAVVVYRFFLSHILAFSLLLSSISLRAVELSVRSVLKLFEFPNKIATKTPTALAHVALHCIDFPPLCIRCKPHL
jgi:hypothetical protein